MFTSTSPSADSVSKLASRAGQLMTPSPHCPHPFIVYHIHFNLLSNIRTAFSHYVVQFHDVFLPSTSTSTRQKGREGGIPALEVEFGRGLGTGEVMKEKKGRREQFRRSSSCTKSEIEKKSSSFRGVRGASGEMVSKGFGSGS
jgi:hypothetical protein